VITNYRHIFVRVRNVYVQNMTFLQETGKLIDVLISCSGTNYLIIKLDLEKVPEITEI